MVAGLKGDRDMQYQVLVRQPAKSHFVASVVGLANVVADGKTETEAINKVKAALADELENAKVMTIELEPKHSLQSKHSYENGDNYTRGGKDDPWIKRAGAFKDDPTWDDFLAEIAAYRKEIDEITD